MSETSEVEDLWSLETKDSKYSIGQQRDVPNGINKSRLSHDGNQQPI